MKTKSQLISFDWKTNGDIMDELQPKLEKLGVYVILDPSEIGSDTFSYVLTNNKDISISEYKSLMVTEYNEWLNECGEWLNSLMVECGLDDNSKLSELVENMI